MAETSDEMRSRTWLGDGGKNGFIARHHLRAMGLGTPQLMSKPVIGIANTWSELTPCNAHLRALAEAVKRGVLEAGGLPLEFPVMSLGEPFMRPSSMLYRNLMAMEVEESLRANPLDAAVLLTGCDKTTPAALMGAASVDLPAIVLTGGPMLNGKYRGKDVGSGTDIWRMTEALRAGEIRQEEFTEFESCLNRSAGHCMTMGTASTMASLTEALGMQLPGAAAVPAVDARRGALAEETGRRAVSLAADGLRPSVILTRAAFENAVRVNAAIGGSTNAVVHLLAVAGRMGVQLNLDDFDILGRDVPLLVDLMPSGRYLMEEFAYAGGVPALLNQMRHVLHLDARTVSGHTLGENIDGAARYDDTVIRNWRDPVQPAGAGTAVLRGNLAPDGAVLKISAASPHLLHHEAFHDDESVDYDGFSEVVAHSLGTGVTSVMFPGFASEFHKLAADERQLLRGRLLDQTRSRSDVAAIVAVQDHATIVAMRRAVEAVADGADAINLLPPYLLGPSRSAVRAHVRAVLLAVAPTPVVLQYAPAQTGTSLDAETIASIAADHTNLVAVKVESTPPGGLIAALAAGTPSLPAFVGYAGLQLPDALRRGAAGVQPGCSFTELYVLLWRLWEASDELAALDLHRRMLPYLSYWMQSIELIVAAEKLISLRRGLISSATCRAPAHALDGVEIEMIQAFLQEFSSELAEFSP